MAKVLLDHGGALHHCPGCNALHVIPLAFPYWKVWEFNGDANSPSFAPSVRHESRTPGKPDTPFICHYYITEGRISYCADSSHALAGIVVDLQEIHP